MDEQAHPSPPNDFKREKTSTQRNQEFDPANIQEHIKRLSHKFPIGHQPYRVIAGEKDIKKNFYRSQLKPKELLFFKNCSDSNYTVSTVCTKVLVENCDNVTIMLNEKVMTNIVELWKCKDVTIHIDTAIYTIQLDICNNVKLLFSHKDNYHQVVWAGVDDLSIEFQKASEHNMQTGLRQMKEIYTDLNDEIDQFIIRFLDDKLTSEQVVRLSNGYPTTKREADEWDAQQAKKDEAAEDRVRKMLDLAPQLGIHNFGLQKSAKGKVGRNEPCPCGSSLKYKKCCANNTQGERLAKSIVPEEKVK
ncbi:uncharacterized protein LOC126320452 [Schistocerca gregaria]|uniref:uncharacterized protein LOC126320452 n=1 Tax=Schistocerca gregaria TaxID=7010 RepID=UPI00211E3E16|nr:uncharacterized protein LOC126320452 [Schistocerca gregaria]